MNRKTVVLVEGDADRRRLLAERIAASGREVVPVRTGAEGARFAAAFLAGSAPSIAFVVSDDGVLANDSPADAARAFEVRYPAELALVGDAFERVIRRLLLALLRSELGGHRGLSGLDADLVLDPEAGALVGDLSVVPLLELLRALGGAASSGTVRTKLGEIVLERGELIAARSGAHRAVKALCRLSLQGAGEVRFLPTPAAGGGAEPGSVVREIFLPLPSLVLAVLEDRLATPPDPEARVRLRLGPQFFGNALGAIEREILGALQQADQVGPLLDALPGRSDGEILRGLGELIRQGVAVLDEPKDRARVVTDTASDLPEAVARAHGILLAPYSLSFGETFVRDREQISPAEFYRLDAARGAAAPAIEPPGRGELLSMFAAGLETQNLVSIHAAPRFGSALNNSLAAADDALRGRVGFRAQLDPLSIEVIDSRSVSLGQGLLAIAAARLAGRGASASAIRRRVVELAAGLRVFAAAREREERQRFGLFVQPVDFWSIYEIDAGELYSRDRTDRESKVPAALLGRVAEAFGAVRPGLVGIAHGELPQAAEALRALVGQRWPAAEVILGEIGPPLGAIFGPGSLLLAALPAVPG
ncbi:MAG: DegV family protein [Acidobacteriota bacterium]